MQLALHWVWILMNHHGCHAISFFVANNQTINYKEGIFPLISCCTQSRTLAMSAIKCSLWEITVELQAIWFNSSGIPNTLMLLCLDPGLIFQVFDIMSKVFDAIFNVYFHLFSHLFNFQQFILIWLENIIKRVQPSTYKRNGWLNLFEVLPWVSYFSFHIFKHDLKGGLIGLVLHIQHLFQESNANK